MSKIAEMRQKRGEMWDKAKTLGSWIIHIEPGVISSVSAAIASTVAAEAAVPETMMWTLPG